MLFNKKEESKRGQVTIFIIIAIVIVVAVLFYVFVLSKLEIKQVPPEFQPAYTNFLSCLQQDLSTAVSVVESQGGYIYMPPFDPGSNYMPFSSQLNFLGNPIPYWYYVSGNNFQREQVPTKTQIEDQISRYMESKVQDCNFNFYQDQGFYILLNNNADAKTSIKGNEADLDLKVDLTIRKDNNSVLLQEHKVSISTNLGSLYDSSQKVYNRLKQQEILENYTIDVLRSYAPVDGVEITCSPLVWDAGKVFNDIRSYLEANINSINVNRDKYFNVDFGQTAGQNVLFLNSKNWTYSMEVSPTQDKLMVAEPVGNQQGLGVLGFCYVPYHFVYSLKYPVLVQVEQGPEIFQFPFAVVVQGNLPRQAANGTAVTNPVAELCLYKNTQVQVNVEDRKGMPIAAANISYECLGTECVIGNTSQSGALNENFPQCVNGYIIAKASGYKDARYQFSTNTPGSVDIIMEKTYSKQIILQVDGQQYNGQAIINFVSSSGDISKTIFYPDQKEIELGEDQYEIQVTAYKNSSLKIGATTKQQCIEVPRPGVLGVFGLAQERCFNIQVPEQLVTNAIYAGGKQNYYMLESQLSATQSIVINVDSFKIPQTIDDVQQNSLLAEQAGLQISLT